MTFGPTLPAVMTRDRDGRPHQTHVFCEWCETIHSHGACATHAADHCHRDDSPYRCSGYDLAVTGEAADPEKIRPARFIVDRGHTLVRHLENVEAALCNAVLRPILGPRRERRFGRARIIMWASRQWSIDPDAFLTAAEYKKPVLSMRPTVWGIGAASLLTELYGLSLGVVAVRLLEAVSGLKLDKRAKLTIAAEVEASQARQARGGK